MNINTATFRDDQGYTLQEALTGAVALIGDAITLEDGHRLEPIGHPTLVPAPDQDSYPGAFQVWIPMGLADDDRMFYLWVDEEGQVVMQTACVHPLPATRVENEYELDERDK